MYCKYHIRRFKYIADMWYFFIFWILILLKHNVTKFYKYFIYPYFFLVTNFLMQIPKMLPFLSIINHFYPFTALIHLIRGTVYVFIFSKRIYIYSWSNVQLSKIILKYYELLKKLFVIFWNISIDIMNISKRSQLHIVVKR